VHELSVATKGTIHQWSTQKSTNFSLLSKIHYLGMNCFAVNEVKAKYPGFGEFVEFLYVALFQRRCFGVIVEARREQTVFSNGQNIILLYFIFGAIFELADQGIYRRMCVFSVIVNFTKRSTSWNSARIALLLHDAKYVRVPKLIQATTLRKSPNLVSSGKNIRVKFSSEAHKYAICGYTHSATLHIPPPTRLGIGTASRRTYHLVVRDKHSKPTYSLQILVIFIL